MKRRTRPGTGHTAPRLVSLRCIQATKREATQDPGLPDTDRATNAASILIHAPYASNRLIGHDQYTSVERCGRDWSPANTKCPR